MREAKWLRYLRTFPLVRLVAADFLRCPGRGRRGLRPRGLLLRGGRRRLRARTFEKTIQCKRAKGEKGRWDGEGQGRPESETAAHACSPHIIPLPSLCVGGLQFFESRLYRSTQRSVAANCQPSAPVPTHCAPRAFGARCPFVFASFAARLDEAHSLPHSRSRTHAPGQRPQGAARAGPRGGLRTRLLASALRGRPGGPDRRRAVHSLAAAQRPAQPGNEGGGL